MNFSTQLDDLIQTLHAFRPLLSLVQVAGPAISKAISEGKKLLTCRNGGSAADALHPSEELVGRFDGNRRSLPSICLCAYPTLLTCIGNDYGFEALFSRQIEALGQPGDVLALFSSSGNSPKAEVCLSK